MKKLDLTMIVPLSGIVLLAATAGSTSSGCASRIYVTSDDGGSTSGLGIPKEGGASSGASGTSGTSGGASGGTSGGTSGASGTSGTSGGTSGTSGTSGGTSGTSGGTSGTSGGLTCPTTAAIDATTFPWKSPSKSPGACTSTELDSLVSMVDKTDDPQKWKSTWTASVGCKACAFGPETTTWPPFVENATGQLASLNIGGCIAIASGKDSCGKAYQQWRSCYLEACADCPDGDSVAFSKCVTAANKGACKKGFDDVIGPTGCGDAQTAGDAETACEGKKYVFEGSVKAQCIGGVP